MLMLVAVLVTMVVVLVERLRGTRESDSLATLDKGLFIATGRWRL